MQQPSFVTPPIRGRGRGPLGLLFAALRRPGGRQASSVLAVILLLAGVGLFSYPFITNIYEHHRQGQLRSEFRSKKFALEYATGTVKVGEGLTELIMPKIHIDVVVVEGTTPTALRAGAGHYVGTALPCAHGNVAIAGHRTTFGHPFNQLDQMHPGDEITLKTPFEECTYKVVPDAQWPPANPHPVLPTDTSVIEQPTSRAVSILTLTTCHPKGSAAFRLVLRAVLEPSKTKVLQQLPPNSILAPDGGAPSTGTSPTTLPGD
jgi:sortase A